MKKLALLLNIIFIYNVLTAQVLNLKTYIEQGRTFDEIYSKASKMVRKGQLNEKSDKVYKKRNKKYKEENEFMRLERWAWYWRDRTNPDGTLMDPTLQWNLYNSAKSNAEFSRASLNWKHEGPTRNTGGYWAMGRTTHIDFHPTNINTFYIAAANGGIWKTTDAGLSYTSLGEELPQQPVGIVIVDQNNPNNIYITIGEKEGWWQYGLGVYKSTDGGKTWKPTGLSYKLTDNKVIYSLEINPSNSNILIAATNNGIYKTINAGTSWTKVRTEDFSDVKFKINNPSIIYAARNDYWGSCEVYQSIDGGDTWNQISNFNKQKSFFKLVITPADPEYLGVNASEDGTRSFYLSKDGGMKFEFISHPPENTVLFISPREKDIVYCGYTKIHKSYDGGYSWTTITNWYNDGILPEVHADHHYISFNNRVRNEIYFCNDGGLHRYDENSETWKELSQGLPITQFYKMAISTSTPPILIGGSQDNGGFIRRSNGNWGNTNGGDAMWQLIDPSDSKIGYTEYWGGRAVYRTTNTFYDLTDIHGNIPGEPQGQWVTPFTLNPKNPKTFIIGYNDIMASHDRGNTFRKISNNLTGAEDKDVRNIDISPVDTNILMATYANQLYTTSNFGQNWTKTTLPTSFDISSIEFHPTDTNKIWLTRAGLGQFKVQESKDRGKTWKSITSNFVNTPALVIRYDSFSNLLFVGTDIGLFYSNADQINWQYYGTGLPNTSVTDIEIHIATRKMYISTYGRGFYSIDLPTRKIPVVLTCPIKQIEPACQTQDSVIAKFASWISTATFTGGCNGVLSYKTKFPSACGDTSVVTFTVKSDCDSLSTCTDTFIVNKVANINLSCPAPVTEASCQTQATIDAKFNTWKTTTSFSGGCAGVVTNTGGAAPNFCGGSTSVTFTVTTDCEVPAPCTTSFSVTPSPQVILTCPAPVTEASCQTQAAIVAKYNSWKNTASFTGGCNGVLTNNGSTAPSLCGGSTFVTFTVSSICETPKTCSATFTVSQAPVVVITCPRNITVSGSDIQSEIEKQFVEWKSTASFTGGCNAVFMNNGINAPSGLGGEANLSFTVSSDCEAPKTCNAKFTVKGGVNTTNLNDYEIEIYPNPANDYIIITSKDKSIRLVDIDFADINGRIVLQKKNLNIQTNDKINIEKLIPGTYLLKIKLDKQTLEHKIEITR